jgi:sugar phosphate isomerase/epimerase
MNWIWFPWPPDMVAIREEQWELAIETWRELADFAFEHDVERIALEGGVLDSRPWDDPTRRSWVFRTVGKGQPAAVWSSLLVALREVGYDDVLSIENEDPLLPGEAGVREAVAFAMSLAA